MKIGISTIIGSRGSSADRAYLVALIRSLLGEAQRHEFVLFVLADDRELFAFAQSGMTLVTVNKTFNKKGLCFIWHQFILPVLAVRLMLDVLHVPSHKSLLGWRPCAQVCTIPNHSFLASGRFRHPLNGFCRQIIGPRLLRRMNLVIAEGQGIAADLTQLVAGAESKVRVVPRGIDHSQFHPRDRIESQRSITLKYGLFGPFFLCVGQLEHPVNHQLQLIEAFNRFKAETGSPWLLVLVGGNGRGAESVHRAVQKSRFMSEIRVLGQVPESSFPDLYRAAGLLIDLPFASGDGAAAMQAMACGCPVLAMSESGSRPEYCRDGGSRIDQENINEMQQEISRLALDPDERERRRINGLAKAAHFNWGTTAVETMAVYAEARILHGPVTQALFGVPALFLRANRMDQNTDSPRATTNLVHS